MTLVLAYRCQAAPSYLQTLISPYTPTRPLRSSCTRRLALPPLRSPASRARSFSTLAPQWWNDLPTDVRTAQSLTTFRLLKTHLFRLPLDTLSLFLNVLYLLLSAPYFTAFNPVL
ncbi:UNVERIFIED_CONTAM: hypothetical protein FKN15_048963 [Acipenser sinensis]